jgi:hypothetical protein
MPAGAAGIARRAPFAHGLRIGRSSFHLQGSVPRPLEIFLFLAIGESGRWLRKSEILQRLQGNSREKDKLHLQLCVCGGMVAVVIHGAIGGTKCAMPAKSSLPGQRDSGCTLVNRAFRGPPGGAAFHGGVSYRRDAAVDGRGKALVAF